MTKYKLFVFALILALTLGMAAFLACSSGDDDDDDSGDDTSAFPDDDNVDDDGADDDAADDDAADDDTGTAPVLSGGAWDPPAFTWNADCADQTAEEACTTLTWSICDVDNDLLPDGLFFIYQAGTTSAAFVDGPAMNISDFNFTTTPDFSDCGAAVAFGIGMLITEDQFPAAGTYEMAVDIEATDNVGNLSNKLTNITVEMTYEG
jgi:hypothetical protein